MSDKTASMLAGASYGSPNYWAKWVEVLGRYSNFPQPLLSGQFVTASQHAKRLEAVQSPAPSVHSIDRRVSPETLQRILGDYQAGVSANQLAARYELSRAAYGGYCGSPASPAATKP